ncbi:unnamed protein product, partial [marine sediment metagenome]
PRRVDSVVIGAQHNPDVNHAQIEQDIIEQVIKVVIPPSIIDDRTKYYVNSTGRFVIGGPVSDTGFTGRKILVDTYGGIARHGGGCFSGKDPTKVDRSAAYAARYIAKNIVAAGLAERLELQISYSIGVAHPLSISIETFGTAKVKQEVILNLINKHFDLRPEAIIRTLDLRRPIYRPTAAKKGYKLAQVLDKNGSLNINDLPLLKQIHAVLFEGKAAEAAIWDYFAAL